MKSPFVISAFEREEKAVWFRVVADVRSQLLAACATCGLLKYLDGLLAAPMLCLVYIVWRSSPAMVVGWMPPVESPS